jgi:TetR/AcrR family acrAB operon transcriptional repressor
MREPSTVRDLRRGQIVSAARAIVAEQGLEALTFGALEQRLVFTRGAITWHFRNKDEIVRAVLQEVIEEIDRSALPAIRAEATLVERARAVIREMTRGCQRSDAGQVLVSFWGRQGTDADAAELNAALYRRYRAYSSQLVRIGQERGEFRRDIDAEAMGVVMVGLVQGMALQGIFEKGALDMDKAIETAADAVVALLTTPGPG